jgi:hypothetical protein
MSEEVMSEVLAAEGVDEGGGKEEMSRVLDRSEKVIFPRPCEISREVCKGVVCSEGDSIRSVTSLRNATLY